jgi:hypothetical protein
MGLQYHAPTKKLTVDVDTLEYVALAMRCSMRHMRTAAGLPLEPYERDGQLTEADHAQKILIDAAEKLGIDLGARWGNELDLREAP